MKHTFICFLGLTICLNSINAQSPATKPGKLYGAMEVYLGWPRLDEFASSGSLYGYYAALKNGKSANIAFSMGGEYFGFNIQYQNERFELDVDKILDSNGYLTSFELNNSGSRYLLFEAFQIGPYLGMNMGKRKRIRVAIMPAIGMMSSIFPGTTIKYDNGGFAVNGKELEYHLLYSLGYQLNYSIWKGLSLGVMARDMMVQTQYSITSRFIASSFLVTMSIRRPF